jgi:hypothetical protein
MLRFRQFTILASFFIMSPVLASDTTLTLAGQIIPSSCTLNIDGNGEFAYGDIDPVHLNQSTQKWLWKKRQTLSVVCAEPTFAALNFFDNRADSAVNQSGFDPNEILGLGYDQAGRPIGGYYILPTTFQLNGAPAQYLASNDSGATWSHSFGGTLIVNSPTYRLTWTAQGLYAPVAFTNATGFLDVVIGIVGRGDLDLTRIVNLDGSSTVELIYL